MFSLASSESSTIASSAGGDFRGLNPGPLLIGGQDNPRRPKTSDHDDRQLLRLTGFKVQCYCRAFVVAASASSATVVFLSFAFQREAQLTKTTPKKVQVSDEHSSRKIAIFSRRASGRPSLMLDSSATNGVSKQNHWHIVPKQILRQ